MSVELNIYTTESPVTGVRITDSAAKKRLEIRFVVPFKCIALTSERLELPLKKQDLMIYCWPRSNRDTTAVLDKALAKGDQASILSVQDKIGWFDFRCEDYDYKKFWAKHRAEKKEFEESISADALTAMRAAKFRYFFRCGLRPRQNADYLGKIAKIVRDLTNGYLGE